MDYGEEVARRALARAAARARSRSRRSRTAARSIAVTIEITDDEFVVDLRDNPDQDPGPNNASRDGSMVAAQMIFMNITDADSVANAGHFRPLQAAHPARARSSTPIRRRRSRPTTRWRSASTT